MPGYLLDENLSKKMIEKLSLVFQKVTHVSNEGLLNSFDTDIWSYAKKNDLTIITKDNDFSDMSHLRGCPPKVIKLNCGNKTTGYISNILVNKSELIKAFTESADCYMEFF
jgi:predicted nuclease of predicted toxin-antitoxin system